ncbi:MAG: hypothetical protein WCI63_03180 [bacterium]
MIKPLSPVLFLADDKKSKTGDPTEDEYEIMIPMGLFPELPYGNMIRMFNEEEARQHKPLGIGYGISFKHAVILGDKHCQGFWIRVTGYRYIKNSPQARMMMEATGDFYLAVQFYEKF